MTLKETPLFFQSLFYLGDAAMETAEVGTPVCCAHLCFHALKRILGCCSVCECLSQFGTIEQFFTNSFVGERFTINLPRPGVCLLLVLLKSLLHLT